MKETNANLIFLDVDKETCIKRLEACNDYRADHKEEWIDYIDKWFSEYRR